MSEMHKLQFGPSDLRLMLLTSVSALALIGAIGSAAVAREENDDRPTVWIELGGQLEKVTDSGMRFEPDFVANNSSSPAFLVPPSNVEQPPRFTNGAEGKVLFSPEGSSWHFSASVRYGRSNGSRHIHQQTAGLLFPPSDTIIGHTPSQVVDGKEFSDAVSKQSQSYAILDFKVGRDVGLGMFGKSNEMEVEAGIRFAQFSSTLSADMLARPLITFQPPHGVKYWDADTFSGHADRNFHGVGPSLSLSGAAPLWGNAGSEHLGLDWGISGAVLFGRQRANVRHETHASRYSFKYTNGVTRYRSLYHHSGSRNASRSVVVPNLGGFVGASLNFPNAKISLGYHADFFFGAIDSGIDLAKKANVGFHGPFASISIGIGG